MCVVYMAKNPLKNLHRSRNAKRTDTKAEQKPHPL